MALRASMTESLQLITFTSDGSKNTQSMKSREIDEGRDDYQQCG